LTLPTALNQKAKASLHREWGPVDFAHFFQPYETGTGDYTADRQTWLGPQTVLELQEEAIQLAAAGKLPAPPRARIHSRHSDLEAIPSTVPGVPAVEGDEKK